MLTLLIAGGVAVNILLTAALVYTNASAMKALKDFKAKI